MGWFDEDDDDDNEQVTQAMQTSSTTKGNDNNNTALAPDAEKEDPLDAFMKTLETTSATTTASAVDTEKKNRHRMDLENDDDEGEGGEWEEQQQRQENEEQGALIINHNNYRISNTDNSNNGKLLFHRAQNPDVEPTTSGAAVATNTRTSITSSVRRRRDDHVFWAARDTPDGRSWRSANHVACSKPVDPLYHWSELKSVAPDSMVEYLLSTIPQPTPVQQQAIPVILQGHNAVITAATGQGKTMAYVIPALIRTRSGSKGVDGVQAQSTTATSVVVLVPTRELALQVEKAARPLLGGGGKCKSVIGGKESNYDVVKDLKRQHYDLIVASPGRLLDVTKKKVNIEASIVVLDECDKLLQMGFEEQVRQLLSTRLVHPHVTRQLVLLSATLGKNVQAVSREWLGPHSIRISVGRTGQASQFVTQHVLVVANEEARTEFCVQMVPTLAQVGRTLVFVSTKTACQALAETIEQKTSVKVVTLHGDKHQWDRTAALKDFAQGRVHVLVATDLASRGLDIPHVATVLNVHPAKNLDSHTHRVGRAGRLDKKTNQQEQGTAYTLLTTSDSDTNFARVLKAAWEREGRSVTPELEQLASMSGASSIRRSNTKRSRDDNVAVGAPPSSFSAPHSPTTTGTSPPAHPEIKKSRWGAARPSNLPPTA